MNQAPEKIKNFTDLIAWQKAQQLVLTTYRVASDLPISEKYGLVSQLQRAAISVTSNIAEGFGRQYSKEKVQFYSISNGSIYELQSQILAARDLGLLDSGIAEQVLGQAVECHKLINGLIKGLRVTNA